MIEDLQGRHQDHESEISAKQDELRLKQEEIDALREGTTSGSEYEPEHDDAQDEDKVEELQHQALVTKKDLNILENAKEGVEMKLERSAQTIKNEAFKVNSEIQFTPILVIAGQVSRKRKRRAAVAGVAVGRHCGEAAEVHL